MLWPERVIFEAKHVLHDGGGWCWCQSWNEDCLPFGYITVHRHFMDRPEYTSEEVADEPRE